MPRENVNSLSTRLDQDQLYSLPRDTAAKDAQAILNPVHNEKGPRIVAAVAVAFAVIVERYSGSPEALYEYGRRILHGDEQFHDKGNAQLEALRDRPLAA